MVYLLKIVILHGYVKLNIQRVYPDSPSRDKLGGSDARYPQDTITPSLTPFLVGGFKHGFCFP